MESTKYTPPKSRKPEYNRTQAYECSIVENGIIIPFSKIFNRDLAAHDFVRLTGKQTFDNNSGMVAWTVSRVLSHSTCNIHLEYLRVLYRIRTYPLSYTLEHLLQDLFVGNPKTNTPAILNTETLNIIDDIQRSIYIDELDDRSQDEDNVIIELQITDYHAIELLKIAMACRFIAPLLCEFIDHSEMHHNDILYQAFVRVCSHMSPDNLNLINKISKFVESRILPTLNNDSTMWYHYSNFGQDHITTTIDIHRQLITDIIPKLENRVVGYLHKAIGYQIKYFFQKRHDGDYSPCKLWDVGVNPDGLDGFDRHSLGSTRNHELYRSVDDLNIQYMITNHRARFGEIPPEKIEYYRKTTGKHELQRRLLFMFYAKKMGDYQSLYLVDNETYYELLCHLEQWLYQTGTLPTIRKLLIGVPCPTQQRTRMRIAQRLSSSTGYKRLIENSYRYVQYQLTSNNNVINDLLSMMSSEFYDTPRYEDWQALVARGEHVNFTWTKIETQPEAICQELVALIEM